jgi:hypothetical protein
MPVRPSLYDLKDSRTALYPHVPPYTRPARRHQLIQQANGGRWQGGATRRFARAQAPAHPAGARPCPAAAAAAAATTRGKGVRAHPSPRAVAAQRRRQPPAEPSPAAGWAGWVGHRCEQALAGIPPRACACRARARARRCPTSRGGGGYTRRNRIQIDRYCKRVRSEAPRRAACFLLAARGESSSRGSNCQDFACTRPAFHTDGRPAPNGQRWPCKTLLLFGGGPSASSGGGALCGRPLPPSPPHPPHNHRRHSRTATTAARAGGARAPSCRRRRGPCRRGRRRTAG